MTKIITGRKHRQASRKHGFLALGVILLAATAVWQFGLAPRWTVRLPRGWSWQSKMVGIATPPDVATGKFPRNDKRALFEKSMRLSDESRRPEAVTVEDRYTITDQETGKVVWESCHQAQVDPRTGAYAQADASKGYYVFPRHTEPHAYAFRSDDAREIALQFEREEAVEGILTYLFTYKGRGAYGEADAGLSDSSSAKVDAGQAVLCVDNQFVYRLWVEPLSGEILKLEASCLSGDYLYDLATTKPVEPVLRWAGITVGDTVVQRAGFIRKEKTKLILITRAVPAGLFFTGILCLAVGLIGRRSRSQESTEMMLPELAITVSGNFYKGGR
jgi:hypothetical protein